MSGSTNSQQLHQLVTTVNAAGIVSQNQISKFSMGKESRPLAAPLTPDQTNLVQSAVVNANHAALLSTVTPELATSSTLSANTIIGKITEVSTDGSNTISDAAGLVANVPILDAGATATLHWWGWTLVLTEAATQALVTILGTDAKGLVTVAAALAPMSAGLAAVFAIVPITLGELSKWITSEDTANPKKGVAINFYLWIAPWVTGND
jgi:hypothetical protein